MTKKTGMQLIAEERDAQMNKGYTTEVDLKKFKKYELKEFAVAMVSARQRFPDGVPEEYRRKLLKKPYQERLAIAGSLLAAEIDRDQEEEILNAPTPEEIDRQIEELKAKKEALSASIAARVATVLMLVLFGFFAKAQCPEGPLTVGFDYASKKVCVAPTYQVDSAAFSAVLITATGAHSYTFNVDGAVQTPSASYYYKPTVPGITSITVTASKSYTNGDVCIGTGVISLTAVACQYTFVPQPDPVGIPELGASSAPPGEAVYYDVQGNRVAKQYNQVLIERVGLHRRKVIFIQ